MSRVDLEIAKHGFDTWNVVHNAEECIKSIWKLNTQFIDRLEKCETLQDQKALNRHMKSEFSKMKSSIAKRIHADYKAEVFQNMQLVESICNAESFALEPDPIQPEYKSIGPMLM